MLDSTIGPLSLGVKISAIWLANTECIYPIFSQQSAISDIFAVQYEILDAKQSFGAKRQFSLRKRGFAIDGFSSCQFD